MEEERLDESTRLWILQLALNKVVRGKEPGVKMTAAEKECYDRNVEDLEWKKENYGDKFKDMTFDIGYDY